MIGDFAGCAPEAFANVVEGVGIIVGAQIGGIADEHIHELAAEFEPRIWEMITEVGLKDRQARPAKKNRPAKQIKKVGIGAARRGAWRVINGRTDIDAGQKGGCIAQTEGVAEIIAELAEVPDGRTRKGKRLKAGD